MKKGLVLLTMLALGLGAQVVGPRSFRNAEQRDQFVKRPPSADVPQQVATSVTIAVTADQATILTKAIADSQDCAKAPGSLEIRCVLIYKDLQEIVQANLNAFVIRLAEKYPLQSTKDAEDAAAAAVKHADEQRKRALPPAK